MTRLRALALVVAFAAACEKDQPTTTPPEGDATADESPADEPTDEPTDEPAAEPKPGEKKPAPIQYVLEIDGKVTNAQIDTLLQDNLNAIRECYDDALTHPDGIELKGAIVVRFTVDKAGAVTTALVDHSEFGHPPTEKCLVGVVEAFKLPKQKGESTVKLPFYMNVL